VATARSAGLLAYRRRAELEVLLGHLGGPYFTRRDDGAWTIPKGEYDDAEEPFLAARREFAEELGIEPPVDGNYLALGDFRQRSGKLVTVWAVEFDLDADTVSSNTFELEWPPRSGRRQTFPELDRAAWFSCDEAIRKAVAGQDAAISRLRDIVGERS
jgi:predicted NUDIX family NTP pyrophosphohydrolase